MDVFIHCRYLSNTVKLPSFLVVNQAVFFPSAKVIYLNRSWLRLVRENTIKMILPARFVSCTSIHFCLKNKKLNFNCGAISIIGLSDRGSQAAAVGPATGLDAELF